MDDFKTFSDLDDLLTRADGTKMTVDEAVRRHYGFRTVWVAALNTHLKERLRKPRLAGYPPKVFISYRWESEELKAWARRLATALEGAGFAPLLDQWQPALESHMDIPKYVGTIADAHYILIIATPAYAGMTHGDENERGAVPDGWVWDEHQAALRLAGAGLTRILCVWKDGDRLPPGCDASNTIDVRGVDDPFAEVTRRFSYAGPRLSPGAQERLLQIVAASRHRLGQGDLEGARDVLMSADAEIRDVFEYQLEVARLFASFGQHQRAIEHLEAVLAGQRPHLDARLSIAETYTVALAPRLALPWLVSLAKANYAPERVHFLIGDSLRDLGSRAGARNHFRMWMARAPQGLAERLGVAVPLPLRPAPSTRPGYTCRACAAEYRVGTGEWLCGDCGSLYAPQGRCPYCDNDGFVPVQMLAALAGASLQCPTCHQGSLEALGPASELATLDPGAPSVAVVALAAEGQPPPLYLLREAQQRLAEGNRHYLMYLVAGALQDEECLEVAHGLAEQAQLPPYADWAAVRELALTVPVDSDAEAAVLEDASYVIRGAARVANALAAGDAATALAITRRIAWPRTRRLLLAACYAAAADAQIIAELSFDPAAC